MRLSGLLILSLVALSLAGCTGNDQTQGSTSDPSPDAPASGSSSTTPPPAGTTPPAPAPTAGPPLVPGRVDADILDAGYDPALVTIEPGNSIVWTNRGGATHSVVSDDGAFSGSGAIGPGESFTFAFNALGDYPYHCRFHPDMTGTIRVR